MTAKELLFSHRYSEAAAAYKALSSEHPDQNYYGSLGRTLLCLGDSTAATAEFQKAYELESRNLKGNWSLLNEMGAAQWLSGNRAVAMATWHRAVKGIIDGDSLYGDLAGGAQQGLLLWYGAVTLGDRQEQQYAIKYFQRLQRRKTYGDVLWPRPVFLMILGEKTVPEILKDAAGSTDLDQCIKLARTDLLKRRELSQALLYSACRDRQNGDTQACDEKMRACANLENPIIEIEWYLARSESLASESMTG